MSAREDRWVPKESDLAEAVKGMTQERAFAVAESAMHGTNTPPPRLEIRAALIYLASAVDENLW